MTSRHFAQSCRALGRAGIRRSPNAQRTTTDCPPSRPVGTGDDSVESACIRAIVPQRRHQGRHQTDGSDAAYSHACMKNLFCAHAIGCRLRDAARTDFADEITLRHRIHRDGSLSLARYSTRPGHSGPPARSGHAVGASTVVGHAYHSTVLRPWRLVAPGEVRSIRQPPLDGEHWHRPFLSVIFEFVDSQGPRTPVTRPATHLQSGSQMACADEAAVLHEQVLSTTDRACTRSDQRAGEGGSILVAVSDPSEEAREPGRSIEKEWRDRTAGRVLRALDEPGEPALSLW